MSFSEWSNNKKKKEQYTSGSGSKPSSFREWSNAKYGIDETTSHHSDSSDDDDIAPVSEKRTWFQKGAFEDGFSIFDIPKTFLGTINDVTQDILAGGLGIVEKTIDSGAYVAGAYGKIFDKDEFAENTKNFIKKDIIDEGAIAHTLVNNTTLGWSETIINGEWEKLNPFYAKGGAKQVFDDIKSGNFGELYNDFEDDIGATREANSLLGDKSDSLVQSGGQLLTQVGLQALGVPWWLTSSVTSFGSEVEQSFNEDKTYLQAGISGAISAGAEILTEKLFGGSGLGEKGLINVEKFTKGISNKAVKALVDWGIDITGEGIEEVASSFISRLGDALIVENDYTVRELLTNEGAFDNYLSQIGTTLFGEEALHEYSESFVGGAVLGGVANVSNVANAHKNGIDYRTHMTANEEAVVEKYVDKAVKEAESEGKKLTKKEKAEIRESVIEQMDTGQLDLDDIESMFGGEEYKSYKDTVENEDKLKVELAELQGMEYGKMNDLQHTRLNELKGMNLDDTTKRDDLRKRLDERLSSVIGKDSRLLETYREKARRRQDFTADLSQYKGKRRAAVERAINSGVLNNTYKAHKLVDTLSQIEADKGITFDYANNAKIKELGFAVEGKTVNGVKQGKHIILNVQSHKAWQSTVGHEIGHVLESTGQYYSDLRNSLYAYAESKGELESRRAELTELYKDMDADVEAELTADLLGDYLFTDSKFIDNLASNRNLFQRIYDEIKYLCKVATGKQLTEIEKVKHEFDRAWKQIQPDVLTQEEKNAINGINEEAQDAEIDDVQHSISVTDKQTLNSLNEQVARGEYNAETNPDGGYYVTYKSMSFWGYDDEGNAILRSPMAEYVDGELSNAYLIPKDKNKLNWYQATETLDEATGLPSGLMVKVKKPGNKSFTYLPAAENQDLIAEDWSNLYFNLQKKVLKNGKWVKSDVPARYNPYEHSSNSMLNDQFSAAYLRDNLVTVKMYVPVSEDNGAFRAKWSKDPTGWADWKTGTVAGKINKQKDLQRRVYLSRYAAPVEIVPDSEVAQAYKEYLDGTDVTIPDNVVSPNLLKELKNAGVPITESGKVQYSISKDSEGNELSLAVQKRFANSKAVDENGNLKVLYHGTASGEFYTFDKSKGSVEGDFGSGFYFTDSESDVEANYEDGGPDFENKVARLAEQIESEEDIDYSEAEARARDELYKGGKKFEVYLNIENPAVVGKTILFDPDKYFGEYNQDDYDSEEDYEGDVEQLISDDIDQILWDIDRNVDVYNTDGITEVLWNAVTEGGIDIEQLKAKINELYLEDRNGNLVGNEVTRQIIESLGYDGIIDNTVSSKFNMNLSEDTTHYIVFKPNQIKSIDNQNPTDNPDIRYSLSEAPLDNGQDLVYNGERGEGYARTDEFRNLQAECQGMSDEDIQLYHSGNKQIDEGLRGRFSRSVRAVFLESQNNGVSNAKGLLNLTAKNNKFNIYEGVNGSLFHDVFEMARNHLKYGELVDLHGTETTEDGIGYNDCYNYLSEDGLSGFSITPDGDLISVFNASGKKGFLRAIAPVVKEKAKTLDCYASENQDLMGMYSAIFGFKPASLMDYNMEYDHDDIAKNHNYPKVAFMVNTESDVETRSFGENEYDEAVTYRNGFIMLENIAPIQKSLSFKGEQPSTVGTPLNELAIAPTQEAVENAPNLADIAPLPDEQLEQGTYENIRPKPESQPRMVRADNVEQERTAEILTEEPQVKKKKRGIFSKAIANFVDKGAVFETLSLKTKNRALQDKYKSIGRSETKAQYFMENGTEGVKSLDSIRSEVESAGLTKSFYEYLYHKHNVDRMSMESKEASNLNRLKREMQELKLNSLKENQLRAIASEKITDETKPHRARLIQTVREYLASKDVKNKPVFGDSVTAEMSQKIADELEATNPILKEYAQDVYNYMNHLRTMMVENGVISQETADLWAEMYPHYVPIRRLGDDDLSINVPLDTNRTGINAPIKRATGGNRDILPLFDTMAQRTIQTFKAIDKNRFGIELKNTLGSTVENTATNLDEVIDSIDAQEGLLQEGKNGKNPTFTVFENGERVTFEITEDMYDALKPTSKGLSYTNKVLNTASNLYRGVLTEFNPVFMANNAIKDTQDVLINSQHPARTYANFPVAIKELATKGKWYKEYMENGGGDNTYFDKQSNTFNKEKSTFRKVIGFPLDKISQANNFIEKVPRLAEYIASRKNGSTVDGAMLDAARVTTDFSAGGDVTKFLNRNGATFLNASVQGFAQQVRNVREAKANGLKGWLGLAAKVTLAGLPAILLNGLLWDDDEEYEELSDYVKENYYVVAKYGDGKFVRIPKGRTTAVIQNAFEQISNALTGDDEADFGRFFELAMSNLAPNNPIDNNIIAPIKQVIENKTWYGEDLVPTRLQDLPAAEQYDESTDSISKWLGETLNVSPYKINYLLNQYGGGLADVGLPMLTPEAESGDDSLIGNLLAPVKDKFTTDGIMNNQNVSDFYNTVDELTTNAKGSGATDEDVLKYKFMNSVNADLSELYAEKREIQNSGLSDSEKYSRVKEIQKQINSITRDALNSYNDVAINGNYATVGDRHYKMNDEGEWQKVNDEQLDKQNEVTSALGISPSEYWANKDEYDYAYKYPEKYSVAKAVGGYDSYKAYSSELYDIKADKDEYGKSINGSRKEKVLDYINNLNADYETKIILWKSEYPSDDTYNVEIIEYLNNREDLTYEDRVSILTELGFKVSNGEVYWD